MSSYSVVCGDGWTVFHGDCDDEHGSFVSCSRAGDAEGIVLCYDVPVDATDVDDVTLLIDRTAEVDVPEAVYTRMYALMLVYCPGLLQFLPGWCRSGRCNP